MIAQHTPIHRQVLLFAFAISAAVLLPVGIVLFTHHVTDFKSHSIQSFGSTARIIASNAAASVAFNDASSAKEILESLSNETSIRSAALFRNDGTVLASYKEVPAMALQKQAQDDIESIVVDVSFKGERLGQLYLQSDLRTQLRKTILVWIGAYAAAFILAGLLAFLLSIRFRKLVADPLRGLARTAKDVTELSDFSLRAPSTGPDEVVRLSRSFNTMLSEIGRRDQQIAEKNQELQQQLDRLKLEIAERERTEELLRETHREMVRLSREAGMAEVASGVLHNIGNVLNSVNVGLELLADNVHDNKRSPARIFHTLFHEPTPEILAVFEAHPRGRELFAVYVGLADKMLDQLNEAGKEVTTLRGKLSHLKDVVTRQQSLAKARTIAEPFDLQDSVKEALILCDDFIQRCGAKVRHLSDGATQVVSDRTYVIQILVNLLRNAEGALAGTPKSERLITLRTGSAEEGRRYVSITDNGCGIAAERLTQIFSFGFTTKNTGHGFGLHSSANAARMLGGSLTVQSDGPGQGATFVLELPYYNLQTRNDSQQS